MLKLTEQELAEGEKLIACLPFADNDAGHDETAAWMRKALADLRAMREALKEIAEYEPDNEMGNQWNINNQAEVARLTLYGGRAGVLRPVPPRDVHPRRGLETEAEETEHPMTTDLPPVERQINELQRYRDGVVVTEQPSGAYLVEIPHKLPAGWNKKEVMIIFLIPPGYPGAQPDCFWVEPGPILLANGESPHATNNSNPVPGLGVRGTWFSLHLQMWNPNRDTLVTYLRTIMRRLDQAVRFTREDHP